MVNVVIVAAAVAVGGNIPVVTAAIQEDLTTTLHV
jgi:hypothetical protein